MTSWIPSSIQKRLLRYALNRSGLLDVTGIDLDNLDISWGRRTVLEFKNVNLNVDYLVGLAKLPPNLRVESARILSLRLTIPADILSSGISFEVNGVDVVAGLAQEEAEQTKAGRDTGRSSRGTQSPSHRKTTRRIQTPPPSRSGKQRLPTTDDLAKSFLAEELPEERQELEASVAAHARPLDESIFSESSDGSDVGTGAAPGLPGFLSAWLQRLVDRFEMSIRAIHVSIKIDASAQDSENDPVHVIASLESVDLLAASHEATKREVQIGNFSIELVANERTLSDLSHMSPPASPAASRATRSSQHSNSMLNQSLDDFYQRQSVHQLSRHVSNSDECMVADSIHRSHNLDASMLTTPLDITEEPNAMDASVNDLGIQMGDDNVSWTSRRSRGSEPVDDPWTQSTESDLPESLILGMSLPLPQSRTSAASSSPTRSRRATSPYDRGIQGPGSWPHLDESPQYSRSSTGTNSSPALDQSQHDLFQSFTSDSPVDATSTVDNKRSALDTSFHEARMSNSSEVSTEGDDGTAGLERSRYFSHEEAESMYVSAVSATKEIHMPGAWGLESTNDMGTGTPRVASPSSVVPASSVHDRATQSGVVSPNPTHHYSNAPSESVTPRGHTPSPMPQETSVLDPVGRTTLQILHVDMVTLLLPHKGGDDVASSSTPSSPPPMTTSINTANLARSRAGMPGAFSTYSQLSSSQRRGTASIMAEREAPTSKWSRPLQTDKSVSETEIRFGRLRLQADVPTAKLAYSIGKALATNHERDVSHAAHEVRSQADGSLAVSVDSVNIEFREQLQVRLDQHDDDLSAALLCVNVHKLKFSSKSAQLDARLGTLRLDLGGHTLLSFDQSVPALSESMIFEEDLRLMIDNSKYTSSDRQIVSLGIETRPVRIDIDIDVFDDVFSTFGGLSGIIDIGSSMASEVSPVSSPIASDRQQRVRFENDAEASNTSPEYKVNASVAGLAFVLCADRTAIALQSASFKGVYREKAASVRFSNAIRLSGPYLDGHSTASIHVDLTGLWIHYLFTPQEQDLERLLSLITPSKDKYDNDDDILLETLLRQRRKGSCLRLTLDDAKIKIDDLASVTHLQALNTQIARLSAVTKYLPEDERPGLLTLARIKNADLRLPVNECFGTLQTTFKELQCAHVGLPALLALSLSDVVISQVNGPELVHALVPLSGSDNLPMIMARMLDDEVEPVVKVKLYNVCVEYSVPVLLDLTGTDSSVDTEEVVAELAASVANLAAGKSDDDYTNRVGSEIKRKTQLHLLLHNSAIGLTPQNSQSKGLLILTDARCSTSVPPADTITVNLELHQAGLLINDDIQGSSELPMSRRNPPESTVVDTRVLNALWKNGYVSVGSIMSAVVNARIRQKSEVEASSVEVDVRNDFLLLETCADSTKTLSVILGGLSPPAPPDKRPKYLTEPITIDDMISSFSGDAYAKPERPVETLFDVDEEPDAAKEDPDDLLMDAEMGSSIYGPISGMIGDLDEDRQHTDQDYGETVESLLEDDPFEMTTSPDDMPFSDAALMKDLRQQALPVKHNESVNLGSYEVEDLGFDALGVDAQALGSRHRFNAPTSRRATDGSTMSTGRLPFKLRLRDVNATWHMHDGYDWQKTRDGITKAVEHVEQRAEERLARRRQARVEPEDEESTIGDCMFNSVYITIPNNLTETPDIRRGINRQIDDLASESESIPASGMSRPTNYSASGRPIRQAHRRRLKLERSRYHKISFELKGISVDLDVFPPADSELQSTVKVRLKQFEIFDNVPTSTWKKFLTQQQTGDTPELAKPMVHIELLNRKTIQEREATDLMIHVAVQPLRLHVDQDALDFITRFTEFKDSASEPPSPSDQPFLSRVEVETVDLKLDYKPKKVDYVGLRSGLATEFMNFVILDQANIKLRHAIVYGIRGFEPLHKTLNDVWMPDVKRNQLPTILAGLAPVRSLVNIGTGVRDVVAIPIREYKKDGRIVRSVQKGAFHFGRTTASELARLGAKVAIGTQTLLSGAEGLLASASERAPQTSDRAGGNSDVLDEDREPRAFSAYADQPLNVLSGLKSARRYLEHDLLTARDALIAVQGDVLESSNPGSAAMAVVRHAPTVMLRPVIGASRAVGTALLGVGNQIDREGVRRWEDKYKPR